MNIMNYENKVNGDYRLICMYRAITDFVCVVLKKFQFFIFRKKKLCVKKFNA